MTTHYHLIGIGGIGMSGLARLAITSPKKQSVSGSDIASNAVVEELIKDGVQVHIGHSAHHIQPGMTVIYSTDIKETNPEYQAALELKCPLLHRSQLLQLLMQDHFSIAIAGTHGKTTTSSLMAWVLQDSEYAPSYAIGGVIPQLKSNANYGNGKHFVFEACESDGTFLNYHPSASIVTNIDLDHMDYYGTTDALEKAFKTFMQKVDPSYLFWCADDISLKALNPSGISYGFSAGCAVLGSNFNQKGWSITFDVQFQGKHYSQVEVALTGKHNALNALAVFGMALLLGVPEERVRKALRSFGGVLRRCEKKGEANDILFLDDYAHHPTELKATLSAIKAAIGNKRLVAIYQPHRYSRAKECMGLYKGTFDGVDELFVTEIYASREAPIPGVTHDKIIEEINETRSSPCTFVWRNNVGTVLAHFVQPQDVVVTLGAGDITKASKEILALLK